MMYRRNARLDSEIERRISIWDGTVHGYELKNMYDNEADYEDICEVAGIDYEDYKED
jgi:hypothetical protein